MTNILCPRERTDNIAYIACTCAHIHWLVVINPVRPTTAFLPIHRNFFHLPLKLHLAFPYSGNYVRCVKDIGNFINP